MKGEKGEKGTRTDRLANDLADAVLAGEFQPGERLDEHMLAERYGVSRTPVREALRQLATSGLIEIKPRCGATVANFTSTQLDTLFIAMGEIEATCARLSAMSMTPIERRRLQSQHEAMAELADREDRGGFAASNLTFHTMIYAGTHNDILIEMAKGLRRRLGPFRHAQFQIEGRPANSQVEHGLVVKAILAGDPSGAHAAMLDHMCRVEEAFDRFAAVAS